MKNKVLLNMFLFIGIPALICAAGIGMVTIKEWTLPAANSFPHDPASGPGGSLWYTGMGSNTIGRLNPNTDEIKEYTLKTPKSGPHGIVSDKEGTIWFTANFKGYMAGSIRSPGRSLSISFQRQRMTRIA